jgi:sugar phosphate isomerase/epimerase
MAAGSFLDLSAEQLIEVCSSSIHLQGIGLRVTGEQAVDRSRWEELRSVVEAQEIAINDVEVYRIGSPLGPYFESVDALIEMAAAIGAQNILVVGDVDDRDLVEVELQRIVNVARDHGVGVGLEYMAWTMPHSVDTARYLAQVTGCHLVVDVLHHTRIGASVEDLARIVADGVLGWVQICDASGAPPLNRTTLIQEARHGRLLPGHGALPLADLLSVIPADTTFSIEVQSDELLKLDPLARMQALTTSTYEVLRKTFSP